MREPARFKLGREWRVRCTVCRYWLPVRCFHADRSRSTGCSTRCKRCEVLYRRAWRDAS